MDSLPDEMCLEIAGWLEPAEQDVLRCVDRRFARITPETYVNLLEYGARHGLLEYCEMGLARGDDDRRVCEIAAERGHLRVIVWAGASGCPWGGSTSMVAAKYGHLKNTRQECF